MNGDRTDGDRMGADRPIDKRVDHAIRLRAAQVTLRARPFNVVMDAAIQRQVRRVQNSPRAQSPGPPGGAQDSPTPVRTQLMQALATRSHAAHPSSRPFEQVVKQGAPARSNPTPPKAQPRRASPDDAVQPPSTSPSRPPAHSAPSPSGPGSPKPTTTTAARALKPQRHLRRVVGRFVKLFVVGTLVVTGATAVWFFWGDIRCAFAAESSADAHDSCAAPEETLRAAANDLLDAIHEGDLVRIRTHLPGRCSESDDALRDAAAKAAERAPTITSVSVLGRGGTVNVESGQKEYVSVWLNIDGRWQLQICDVLDRLAGS